MLDITILVQGENFHAHKMLLCAASPYFKKQILSIRYPPGTSQDQSLICFVIDKCTPKQFSYLLDYIYKGEANVPEEDLAGVLKAAEELQITGLYSGLTNGHLNGHANGHADQNGIVESRNGQIKHESLDQGTQERKSDSNSVTSFPGPSKDYVPKELPTSRPPSGGSNSSGSVRSGKFRF